MKSMRVLLSALFLIVNVSANSQQSGQACSCANGKSGTEVCNQVPNSNAYSCGCSCQKNP